MKHLCDCVGCVEMRRMYPTNAVATGTDAERLEAGRKAMEAIRIRHEARVKAIQGMDKRDAPQQKVGAPSGGFWFGVPASEPAELTCEDLELDLSKPCTASPTCGLPDEVCGVCRAKNCPGVNCWKCGGKK